MARNFLSLINTNVNGLKSGILKPVPSCPSYSAMIAELGLQKIDYYIDEDKQCSINIAELQVSTLTKIKKKKHNIIISIGFTIVNHEMPGYEIQSP